MSTTYNDVLNRLKEERKRLSLSQNEMSRYARMSQSNYSKVELGTRRFSYSELKYLCETQADVQYIFTGQRAGKEYMDFFERYSYVKLLDILNILSAVDVAVSGKNTNERWRDVYINAEGVYCRGEMYRENPNMVSVIRRLNYYRQQEMARNLGVDVKKFRDLENGRSLPDSELVWRLYDMFNIPPAIILKDKNCLVSEICCILEKFDSETKDKVMAVIQLIDDRV